MLSRGGRLVVEQVFSSHNALGMNSRKQKLIEFNRDQESLGERKEEREKGSSYTVCTANPNAWEVRTREFRVQD